MLPDASSNRDTAKTMTGGSPRGNRKLPFRHSFLLHIPEIRNESALQQDSNPLERHLPIVEYIRKAAEIFGSEYERIKSEMRRLNCHYDDTGQRVAGNNQWLWEFISKEVTLYHTSKSRSKIKRCK